MKNLSVTKKQDGFQPLEIKFTLETQEELDSLRLRLLPRTEEILSMIKKDELYQRYSRVNKDLIEQVTESIEIEGEKEELTALYQMLQPT